MLRPSSAPTAARKSSIQTSSNSKFTPRPTIRSYGPKRSAGKLNFTFHLTHSQRVELQRHVFDILDFLALKIDRDCSEINATNTNINRPGIVWDEKKPEVK
jgi:hypothetical protein